MVFHAFVEGLCVMPMNKVYHAAYGTAGFSQPLVSIALVAAKHSAPRYQPMRLSILKISNGCLAKMYLLAIKVMLTSAFSFAVNVVQHFILGRLVCRSWCNVNNSINRTAVRRLPFPIKYLGEFYDLSR